MRNKLKLKKNIIKEKMLYSLILLGKNNLPFIQYEIQKKIINYIYFNNIQYSNYFNNNINYIYSPSVFIYNIRKLLNDINNTIGQIITHRKKINILLDILYYNYNMIYNNSDFKPLQLAIKNKLTNIFNILVNSGLDTYYKSKEYKINVICIKKVIILYKIYFNVLLQQEHQLETHPDLSVINIYTELRNINIC